MDLHSYVKSLLDGISIFLSLGFTQICPNPDVYGGISLLNISRMVDTSSLAI